MSRRKDPGAAVIDFFETAPPDAANAVLGICKGNNILDAPHGRRQYSPRDGRQ